MQIFSKTQCALEHHAFYRLKSAAVAINTGKPQRQNFVRMGSRFRYSGKTEFQSTMMRAQQQTRANENKSTFERRPSQRFASRRSRMDRTRPNITSSSSASATTTNNNNTTTTTTTNNNKSNTTNSSNSNNVHTEGNNNISSSANNAIDSISQVNQSKQVSNDTPQGTVKPNIVVNSGASRHPILQSKPVKPPTVPPGAPYGITMQTKQATNQAPSVSINNNNIHHYLKDRQTTDFSDCADLLVSKPSQEHAQSTNQNSNFSAHIHSKSQPNMPIKSHHYINYKPPDSQPPPPPPPKPFDNKVNRNQPQRIQINSEEEQQVAAAEASTVAARKPSRLACSFSPEQKNPEANHHNGSIHHNKHHQQQGEVINSSSMPPPPPPPHTMPRSVSNQALTNQTNNKQLANHSQASIIKPICVTEL